jgi:hypothetical protein
VVAGGADAKVEFNSAPPILLTAGLHAINISKANMLATNTSFTIHSFSATLAAFNVVCFSIHGHFPKKIVSAISGNCFQYNFGLGIDRLTKHHPNAFIGMPETIYQSTIKFQSAA